MSINKTKILATIIASFVVFFATLFALAENKNSHNLFLDSDQDGLTDQEEKMIGTDIANPDTDGDGYSDGKELKSGYSPLKPAPGDALIFNSQTQSAQKQKEEAETKPASQGKVLQNDSQLGSGLDLGLGELTNTSSLEQNIFTNLSSDPQNPNLTNEIIGEFLKLTKTKSDESEDFLDNPSLSADDFDAITANALKKTSIAAELPEIRPDEMKVLPPIDDKKLDKKEVKEKQKEEIQKYLASLAFIFATNAPFPVDQPENLASSLGQEQESLLSAMTSGDQSKIDEYAQRARAGIEQIKKVEVPYILQDIHKSALQLAIYTLSLKDEVVIDQNDPMKNLAALSSLQAVAESVLKLQSEMQAVLEKYGIKEIELK